VSNQAAKFLTRKDVLKRIPLCYSSIWNLMRLGQFPRPHITGAGPNRKVLWLEDEVEAWMRGLPRQVYKRPGKRDRKAA
jgi:predicted DNA-binding transcriptional regulator AlpA